MSEPNTDTIELPVVDDNQPTLFTYLDADQASAQSSTVATRDDSPLWQATLRDRAEAELSRIEAQALTRRIELDRWFTTRVNDAFETFTGDVLAGVLYQLTMATEVGLGSIDQEAAEKIARRAVLG